MCNVLHTYVTLAKYTKFQTSNHAVMKLRCIVLYMAALWSHAIMISVSYDTVQCYSVMSYTTWSQCGYVTSQFQVSLLSCCFSCVQFLRISSAFQFEQNSKTLPKTITRALYTVARPSVKIIPFKDKNFVCKLSNFLCQGCDPVWLYVLCMAS